MSIQSGFDLSDGYNRIADSWYPIFASGAQLAMPVAACAYPINMGEQTIAAMRDELQPEDWFLRWQMALAGGGVGAEYQLYCNWQGRAWLHDDVRCLFIDNAVGWVDWIGPADGDVAAASRLTVQIAFGRPTFENEIGSLTVDFAVTETDESGAIQREVRRPFQIWADGRRTALF